MIIDKELIFDYIKKNHYNQISEIISIDIIDYDDTEHYLRSTIHVTNWSLYPFYVYLDTVTYEKLYHKKYLREKKLKRILKK